MKNPSGIKLNSKIQGLMKGFGGARATLGAGGFAGGMARNFMNRDMSKRFDLQSFFGDKGDFWKKYEKQEGDDEEGDSEPRGKRVRKGRTRRPRHTRKERPNNA